MINEWSGITAHLNPSSIGNRRCTDFIIVAQASSQKSIVGLFVVMFARSAYYEIDLPVAVVVDGGAEKEEADPEIDPG